MTRIRRQTALVMAALTLLGTLVGGLRPTGAQEAATDHPAHIHQGTCAALDHNPAYPLNDVVLTPPPSPAAGAATALPVATSVTTVPVALSDLLASPYAINVHESATAIGHYLACGDIGGTPVGADLTIGLRLLGTDGYAGIAVLHADGTQTVVTLNLVVGLPPVAAGEPAAVATPEAGATLVAVTVVDMQVEPAQTMFKVGQPYTFVITNQGRSVHEFVIERRDDIDKPLKQGSGEAEASNIAPGQTATLTWTFTEAGAYKFSCHLPGHYEAGMTVDVDVTA
jgi:uncharacterized cupredoxin-like copper-binding protein